MPPTPSRPQPAWTQPRPYEPPRPLPADKPTPPDKYDGYLDLVAGRKRLDPRPPVPEHKPEQPQAAPGTEREAAHEAIESAVKAARKSNNHA